MSQLSQTVRVVGNKLTLATWACTQRPVTLFLAPEAGLTPFYMTHAFLSRLMRESGHAAIMLSCNGIQRTCSFKMCAGLRVTEAGNSNDSTCVACREQATKVGYDYGLIDLSIKSLLDVDATSKIKSILEVYDTVPSEAVYDGIEFGTACLGETMRAKGKSVVADLSAEDDELTRALLQAALCVYFAIEALSTRYNVKRIIYFGDYAYFLPAHIFAERSGIALTHIGHAYNGDIDRRKTLLLPGFAFLEGRKQVEQWPRYRDRPIATETVDGILDGALFRLSGHGGVSTFSPNWNVDHSDIRAELGLDPRRRTLVAFASSFDEVACIGQFLRFFKAPFGQAEKPFDDQASWLKHISQWVGERDDLQLVIRLHPRMAANARTPGAAAQYARIMGELSDAPSNVVVVGADSKLSSYNIAEVADVALIAWSSMGIELGRFGVPVICAFPGMSMLPIGGFAGYAPDAAGYFRAIDTALAAGTLGRLDC